MRAAFEKHIVKGQFNSFFCPLCIYYVYVKKLSCRRLRERECLKNKNGVNVQKEVA